ncbi:hypothetical protein [Streptomyces chryseus]
MHPSDLDGNTGAPPLPRPDGTLPVTNFRARVVAFLDPDQGPVDSARVATVPYGLAVGADGRAWGATAESSRSSPPRPANVAASSGFTRDGYWNGITVVDPDTGKTHGLPAGHHPLGIAAL